MTNHTAPTRLSLPSLDHFDEAGRAMTQQQLSDMNFDGTTDGDFAAENSTIVAADSSS
jgi:hypothetical protein